MLKIKNVIQNKTVALFLAFALILSLTGCNDKNAKDSSYSNTNYKATNTDYLDKDWDLNIKNSEETKVFENNYLKLLVKGKNCEIIIEDKSNGMRWYSNPVDKSEDKIAIAGQADLLKSQVSVDCEDAVGTKVLLTSFADSVSKSQYNFVKLKDGLRVDYVLGQPLKEKLFPKILSKERFEYINSKLDSADKIELSTYYSLTSLKDFQSDAIKELNLLKYPILKSKSVYIFNTGYPTDEIPDFIRESYNAIFTKVGYTPQDRIKDNKENKVVETTEQLKNVSLSIEYTLNGSDLMVNVPQSKIKYDKKVLNLTKINLLPFFGAASSKANGYMFIPDGSGAIINLNNGKTNYPMYSKKVYSNDKSNNKENDVFENKQINLPIYGVKDDNKAFLAIIEKGDAISTINACISGKFNNYNYIYSTFTINDDIKQTNSLVNLSGNKIYQKNQALTDYTIRYKFLYNNEANYSGMAKAYQKYLVDNNLINKQKSRVDYTFFLNLVGSIDYQSSFLGIPVSKNLELTGYKQVQIILDKLISSGVTNIVAEYSSWQNGGYNNYYINKIELLSSLGNKTDFHNLLSYTNKKGIDFYLQSDFQYVKRTKLFDGFNKLKFAARDYSGSISKLDNTFLGNKNDENQYIVSPSAYKSNINSYLKSFSEFNNNFISLKNFGLDINSDSNEKIYVDSSKSKETITQSIYELSQKGYKILLNNANAYALKNTSKINNVPMESSKNYLFDDSIPFYQMVIRGYIQYASEPINTSSDYKTSLLKLYETGSSPLFEWMYAENSSLINTDIDLYGVNYENWLDIATKSYKELNEVFKNIGNSKISSHINIAKNVYMTKYENGITIYVNYNNTAYISNDISVEPKGYFVKKG